MPEAPPPRTLVFETALLDGGWAKDVAIAIADGVITEVSAGTLHPLAERVTGAALPGLANIHSRAVERGLAGLAQRGGDDEGAWRDLRARFTGALVPDDVEAIAALAYAEMLEAGFTAVAEFHDLHHGPDGRPYGDRAELAARVVTGAQQAGIALTLLPVFQTHGGFGPRPPQPWQRRAALDLDGYLALLEAAHLPVSLSPGTLLGIGVHSLRTATIGDIRALVAAQPGLPVQMMIAAHDTEVAESLAVTGARPVDHLLDWVPVDSRWSLVHATYLADEERTRLAHCGAVVGLCPAAEADRGEAQFDAVRHIGAGGRLGIGTASNVRTCAAELLRVLEHGQRQRDRAVGRMALPGNSTGRALFEIARFGGAQGVARPVPRLAAGAPADIVVLDLLLPSFAARSGDRLLDSWIFAPEPHAVRDVWAAGEQVVKDGRHRDRPRLVRRYRTALERLLASL